MGYLYPFYQLIKSLHDPLEAVNDLTGIDDNDNDNVGKRGYNYYNHLTASFPGQPG